MKLLIALAAVAALALPAAAQPKSKPRPAARKATAAAPAITPAGTKKPVFFDFTGDNIDGDRIRPDGTTIFGLRDARHGSLIKLRGDFLREIVKTGERL